MEPLFEVEDRISVDAKHVQATAQWPGGFFASYHAYPYYPDFLRFEYEGGQPSPYAAYLGQLRQHHAGQALMVTEFGVPTGLGAAHRGPGGRAARTRSRACSASASAKPWVSPRLILSRPLTIPTTGQTFAPEFLDLGTLRWGGSDVRRLAAGSGKTAEILIPWLLLGFADPSSRTIYTPQASGLAFNRVTGITVNGRRYTWPTWNEVDWHERRKQGWPILKSAFARAAR